MPHGLWETWFAYKYFDIHVLTTLRSLQIVLLNFGTCWKSDRVKTRGIFVTKHSMLFPGRIVAEREKEIKIIIATNYWNTGKRRNLEYVMKTWTLKIQIWFYHSWKPFYLRECITWHRMWSFVAETSSGYLRHQGSGRWGRYTPPKKNKELI